MYPTYSEVFEESNNWENKEALWKHRWYAGTDGHGSSNGNYKLNRNDEYFLCDINKFGAREDNQETRLTWEGSISGIFMPTQHLLNLYVQNDGTLDPDSTSHSLPNGRPIKVILGTKVPYTCTTKTKQSSAKL